MSTNPISRRRGYTTTSSSSQSDMSSDDDAITPCPPHSHPNAELANADLEHQHQHQHRRRPSIPRPSRRRQRPTSWRSTLSSTEPDTTVETDPETLWRRMLALQRMFGCYNSARMRAALDQDEDPAGVPSRTCLDLLNDSIDALPEEERERVEAFLEGSSAGEGKGRGWRGRLLGL